MSSSRRTFLKLLGYGAVVAAVPTALATRKEADLEEPYYAAEHLDLSKYPRMPSLEEEWALYEAGEVRLERMVKVGGGERDWSWVECKREDLRRGDVFRFVNQRAGATIHMADDSYPEPDVEDSTRGTKGMRSVEVLDYNNRYCAIQTGLVPGDSVYLHVPKGIDLDSLRTTPVVEPVSESAPAVAATVTP